MKTLGFQGFHWRRGWDSNPCAIARKLISSQPRYDHFDTSPYMLTRHTEINAIFSCIRIPVRTGVVLETMECPKPARLMGFRRFGFRLAKNFSSADPSATWVHLRMCDLAHRMILYLQNLLLSREKRELEKVGGTNRIFWNLCKDAKKPEESLFIDIEKQRRDRLFPKKRRKPRSLSIAFSVAN